MSFFSAAAVAALISKIINKEKGSTGRGTRHLVLLCVPILSVVVVVVVVPDRAFRLVWGAMYLLGVVYQLQVSSDNNR